MTKISELTAVTTAAATDTLPVVQGGVTKKVTIQDYIDDGILGEPGGVSDVGDLTTTGLTPGNMLRIDNPSGLEERTPAQVLADIGAEPALGNPGTNGYLLSSTTGGTRSWIAPASGGAWGGITGTLADQTDLNTALGLKANLASAISATATGDYRMIACVIRNNAGTWELINDSTHEPVGISSISQDGSSIVLTFSFTGAQVISASVTPDEQYFGRYDFGASVAVGSMTINCGRVSRGAHKSWVCSLTASTPYFSVSASEGGAQAPAAVTWSAGELTIQHNAVEAGLVKGVPIIDPMGWEVNVRTGRNTINYTYTYLKFYTLAGVQITDPALFPAGFRFVLERADYVAGFSVLNPNAAELQISNSNVWIMALLKMS